MNKNKANLQKLFQAAKTQIKSQLKKNPSLYIAFAFYVFLAALLFKFYRYQINPDGVSYISIAQKYLQGHFFEAIDGYWSPLFSWLMLPFLALGVDSLIASKLVLLLGGFLIIPGFYLLLKNLKIKRGLLIAVSVAIVPQILIFAFHAITPDILSVTIIFFYLALLTDKEKMFQPKNAVLIGLLGGLAYLNKSYNFSFIFLHLLLSYALIYFFCLEPREARKKITRQFLIAFSVFLLISLSWAGLLSLKYKKLTLGTSGAYNLALIQPHSKGHPTHYLGFIAPPDQYSISIWDDPSLLKLDNWNPFSSVENLDYEKRVIKQNLIYFPSVFLYYAAFVITVIVGITAYSIFKKRPKEFSPNWVATIAAGAAVLYPLGYLLIFIYERYVWSSMLILVALTCFFLTWLFRFKIFKPYHQAIIIAFFALALFFLPYNFFSNQKNWYQSKDIYDLSQTLKQYQLQDRLASNQGTWQDSLNIAYYLGLSYWGEANRQMDDNPVLLGQKLQENKIDYYLVWGKKEYPTLDKCPEITQGNFENLRVYDLRKFHSN